MPESTDLNILHVVLHFLKGGLTLQYGGPYLEIKGLRQRLSEHQASMQDTSLTMLIYVTDAPACPSCRPVSAIEAYKGTKGRHLQCSAIVTENVGAPAALIFRTESESLSILEF